MKECKPLGTFLLDERINSLAKNLNFADAAVDDDAHQTVEQREQRRQNDDGANDAIMTIVGHSPATVINVAANTPQSDEDSVCADIDRWASSSLDDSSSQINESAKVRELEQEQERLSESVLALSTHFAHIQFRIQQISVAPTEQRDSLLKELQEFASKGCVDLGQLKRDAKQLKSTYDLEQQQQQEPSGSVVTTSATATSVADAAVASSLAQGKRAQAHNANANGNGSGVVALIGQLRAQLEELERFAYESGQHGELPLSELKQRQKLVFDKLQEKVRLKIELEKLSGTEFQKTVEDGIEQILNPIREKEQLVDQLQTQIVDLERFVAFLQLECAHLSPGDGYLAYDSNEFLSAASFDDAARRQKFSTHSGDIFRKSTTLNNAIAQKRSLGALIGRSLSEISSGGSSVCVSPPLLSPTSLSPLKVADASAVGMCGGGQMGGISGIAANRPSMIQRSFSSVASAVPSSTGVSATSQTQQHSQQQPWLVRWLSCRSGRKFEKNELKRTSLCNHYGDQRARMELAVHAVAQVMQKHQILSVDRSERHAMPVEQLNETIFECSDEAIVGVVRKELCPALKDLLEHGLRASVALRDDENDSLGFTLLVPSFLGCASKRASSYANRMNSALKKFDGQKLEHIWDVVNLFYECSRALEMRDAAVGRLTDAFKLETVDGRIATSKQVLLATVENVKSTHARLQRSPDTMWKAFVCAALNNDRLPGWIRIIFRSTFITKKCYNSWAYVARTGCEDIRPLLERLSEYNFDLPVDLAVRPFDYIKEAF